MRSTVVIDFLPESAARYRAGWIVVAIDVIRATTTAITAAARGQRCLPVPTLDAATDVAALLEHPLLCGELGGNMPFGWDLTNSPAQVAALPHWGRPLVLLSSSGTQLVHNAARADVVYLACLRNHGATVAHLAARQAHVAVIGAGTRGEFREEDQCCCALVAGGLARAGYAVGDETTRMVLDRWKARGPTDWQESRSVDYLRRSGQVRDLEFILDHVDDLDRVFSVEDGEVVVRHPVTGERDASHAFPLFASPGAE